MALRNQRAGENSLDPSPALHSVGLARRAQRDWAEIPLMDRLQTVREFRWALARQGPELAASLDLPRSGGIAETLSAEILPLADACRFLERKADRLLAPRRLGFRNRPLWLTGSKAVVEREPFGVVLIIAAANYPILLPGVQTLQALVGGNAVLLKPGAGCSRAARGLVDLLESSGLPANLVAVLDEAPEAAQWAMDAGVDKVLLTGSVATGREVLARLATTITPATVELSGCDAVFVLPDADLDLVARALAFGMRLNGGATCIAPRRVFVPKNRLYALQEALSERLTDTREMQVPARTADLVTDLVREAELDGAAVACGGLPRANRMRPLVITNAEPKMRLLRTDVFAPVLSLVGVEDSDEALAFDARCPYALGAAVFGPAAIAQRFAHQVRAGVVQVNDMIVSTADPRIPFGGRGLSGFGVTRGVEGLLELTVPKVVLERKSKKHPHLEPLQPGDDRLFSSYLAAAHSRSWRDRVIGWRRLISELRRKSRSLKA